MNKFYLLCLLPALPGLISNLYGGGYVTAIAGGSQHSLFLKSDGAVWGIGGNFAGQLGDGTNRVKYVAVHVMDNVSAISAGQSHSLFLRTDSTVWATGWNGLGQLGDGTTTDRSTPVFVMDNVGLKVIHQLQPSLGIMVALMSQHHLLKQSAMAQQYNLSSTLIMTTLFPLLQAVG